MKPQNKLLIICGPTATGKTALSLKLAQKYDGELVSADSRQGYRGMDIGTGKDLPGKKFIFEILQFTVKYKNNIYTVFPYLLNNIPIWMYDVVRPDEAFSVAHYQALATAVIDNIWSRGKLPIVVGGTGLYVKSLTDHLETIHIPPDVTLRRHLQDKSLDYLQAELCSIAPMIWDRLNASDRQNPRRLIRKIEIVNSHKTNKPACEREFFQTKHDVCAIVLSTALSVLYRRVDARVDRRIEQGMIAEIEDLLRKGYTWDLPSFAALGYRQWKSYIEAPDKDKPQMFIGAVNQWKSDEHAYARRQVTWFKKNFSAQWYDICNKSYRVKVEKLVDAWYTHG
ncbi:tRNA (adenosine(37)-N6)-dimethylallyltransferase MiaA [Patescibacteria group bacterium]|nr:tRNA (adenosine(37)-N6)-dimethylallyltransferase MiaA [Patescibacteria group bacterium]MBU1472263.1 tRNA (adenosine(37)-N6)-dimethylallyltransferase MiaA [Patescibacteria group bacterium]MBU2460486.1 tRNA (adenosine(37)-N6)-dimethylallyltransferase MiaA [Patescibacteria group bacterium]MBU2544021.1 tRNA (adenosine(37)-N6)-dimethylallyltransferase MiaA [Patescibacteria group bacterium]